MGSEKNITSEAYGRKFPVQTSHSGDCIKVFEELEDRVRFETFISDLSARFVNIDLNHVDKEVNGALKQVFEFFQADRCGLLGISHTGKQVHVTHAAYADGIEHVSAEVDLAAMFPWCREKIVLQGQPVCFSKVEELPDTAVRDRESYTAMGIRSALHIPLFFEGRVESVIVINALRRHCSWPEGCIPRLRMLGEIFLNALAHKQKDQELKKAYSDIVNLKEQIEIENIYLRHEMALSSGHDENFIGQSDAMRYVFFRVRQVAASDLSVLITGETGTGKGMVARAVHQASGRKHLPMVTVNCAALPANLIESELFGREKGAFTGAHAGQVGRFELAHKGTIFLDEIGELPMELQAKLLRVVEDGEFERLGSPHTIKVDVRIIASTNHDLEKRMLDGRFREDLYYRLNVFPITIPPLRDRKDDIPLLVQHFAEKIGKKMGKHITSVPRSVMKSLQEYQWRGNVRELVHVIERSVMVAQNQVLTFADPLHVSFSDRLKEPPVRVPLQSVTSRNSPPVRSLTEAERSHIVRMLDEAGWKIEGAKGAAHLLGLKPSTLRSRMKKLGIQKLNTNTAH